MKWIRNKINGIETLSSIERQILDVKLQIKILKDNKLKRDISEVNLIKISEIYNAREMEDDVRENKLESKLEQLETKRQHFLDRRNGWVSRVLFSVVAPIVVTVLTTYLLNVFSLLK